MGKDKKCPTCKLNPAVYKLVVGLLAEWERNIPRMADETPAENSLRARTLSALAAAATQGEATHG